mgnify:FL=1
MNIKLKFTNLESTVAIETYADTKFGMLKKVLSHLDPDDMADLHLELAHTTMHHQKGNVYAVKANLHIPGKIFQISEEADNLYSAIDIAKDTLYRSVEKYMEMKKDEKGK